jgi:hypothetical protein
VCAGSRLSLEEVPDERGQSEPVVVDADEDVVLEPVDLLSLVRPVVGVEIDVACVGKSFVFVGVVGLGWGRGARQSWPQLFSADEEVVSEGLATGLL